MNRRRVDAEKTVRLGKLIQQGPSEGHDPERCACDECISRVILISQVPDEALFDEYE